MRAAPAHSRGARRRRRPVWSWLLPALSLVAAAGIPLFAWYAGDAILNSADGDLTQRVTDPSAPGYEVIVLPSPSHMVLSLDPVGDLAMVTVMSLGSNDLGGTVLHIPPEAVLDGDRRLIDVFREEGEAATRRAAATLMDVNVDGMSVLDAAGWTQLVAPAGAIPVDTVQDLYRVGGDGDEIVYPAGNVTVAPENVSEFLAWVNPGAHASTRMGRHVSFWRAWIATIAASTDPGIVPGEIDSGIGRFLRGLAVGVPVVAHAEGTHRHLDSGAPATDVDLDKLRAVVAEMIPFPLPVSPGARPRVRLLDGVGGVDLAALHSPGLVNAGAQIVIIGNASSFDVAQTEVIYHAEAFESHAEGFSQALGGANVTFEPIQDVVLDVTVIIGEDQSLALG